MPKRPRVAPAAASHPLISNKRLQQLYVTLLECRMLRQRSRGKQRPAPLVAREAIVTGTVAHLETGDAVMPIPGDHLAALARGNTLRKVLVDASLAGVLPAAATPAARFAIATGAALAQRQQRQVVLAFSGPGIESLQPLRDSLTFAATHKLGIVFILESAADADVSSARHTDALGLPGIPVDGNDVIAIYRVAQEAITRARRGGGPTLIDCKPWPLGPAADPVRKLEQALERRGLLLPSLRKRTEVAFARALSRSPTTRPRDRRL